MTREEQIISLKGIDFCGKNERSNNVLKIPERRRIMMTRKAVYIIVGVAVVLFSLMPVYGAAPAKITLKIIQRDR
jgi:hypothetical protein